MGTRSYALNVKPSTMKPGTPLRISMSTVPEAGFIYGSFECTNAHQFTASTDSKHCPTCKDGSLKSVELSNEIPDNAMTYKAKCANHGELNASAEIANCTICGCDLERQTTLASMKVGQVIASKSI